MRSAVLVLVCVACGDNLAEPEPALVCSTFGPPVEAAYTLPDYGLSANLLEVWFTEPYSMRVARRSDPNSPFGNPDDGGVLTDRVAGNPRLSGDGTHLFWLQAHMTEPRTLREAHRASPGTAFGNSKFDAIPAPLGQQWSSDIRVMDVSLDALTVYYSSLGVVYATVRQSELAPFEVPVVVGDLGATSVSISPDEHELYFDRSDTEPGVFRLVRESRDALWGTEEEVISAVARDPELSADGTILFLHYGTTLMTMTRTCTK